MQAAVDKLTPQGKWVFDGDVTAVFDNMLQRSIPQYELMRQAVFDMAYPFVQPETVILDLGCSQGEALAPFVAMFGPNNRYLGIDVSEPMLTAARQRFDDFIAAQVVDIRHHDLRAGYPAIAASVTLSVLTLQFTPIEYRQRIVRDIYHHTVPGGAFILVEKILGISADIDALLVKNYYALKRQNGYSQEQIERKRLALEGVLVPVTARWNEDLLSAAGFQQIDCFWRWMNFAAWIAIK